MKVVRPAPLCPLLAATAVLAALSMRPAFATSSWSVSAGAESDQDHAHSFDGSLTWSPSDKLTLSLSGARISSDEDAEGSLDASTTAVGLDWQPLKHVGLAVGYDAWDSSNAYEKGTARATLRVGGSRGHVGLVAEAIESETTAELATLRRETSYALDGSGYGLELQFIGQRVDAYATYMGYDYDDSADRLLAFLANPNLASRPRLEGLIESGLTAAGTLLDSSMSAGVNFHVRQARIGLAYAGFRDILSETDTRSLSADIEWPLTKHWSAVLAAGASDNDISDTNLVGGFHILFHAP